MYSSTLNPASAVDDTEMQRAMLRRLAVLGMRLAEEVVERAVNSPYHPEAVHEPGRAFAQVSRAVRLTIALQVKLDAGALAPRKVGGKAETTARVRSGADGAASDSDDGRGAHDPAGETLREGESESYAEIGGRSFDDCVVAIHTDLGVDADGNVVVAAASASVDETSVLQEPARVKLGYWPQQQWPYPAEPLGSRPPVVPTPLTPLSVTPPSTHPPTA